MRRRSGTTRLRPRPAAELGLALLAGGLALAVAGSVRTAGWVPGLEPLPWLALGAVAVGLAAGRASRLSGPLALGAVTLLVTGGLGLWAAGAGLAGRPPEAGQAPGTGGGVALRLLLAATCCLGSAWLGLAVLRLRLVLAGLLPLGILFAVTLLNFPAGQGGYVLLFLLLTVSLLLALGWERAGSVAAAASLAGRGRILRMWAAGAALGLVTILAGFALPPASAVDRSAGVAPLAGLVQLEQRLRGAAPGGAAGTIGFSLDLPLSGPLQASPGSDTVVLRYRPPASPASRAPAYLRGVNLTLGPAGWQFAAGGPGQSLPSGAVAPGTAGLAAITTATYEVDVANPPPAARDTIFYPGELAGLDRDVQLVQGAGGLLIVGRGSDVPVQVVPAGHGQAGPAFTYAPGVAARQGLVRSAPVLHAADQVRSVVPATSAGRYQVQVDQSAATEDQLRAAGTAYPSWLGPYLGVPGTARRSADWQRLRELALQVTSHASNPYDAATAIESYLRGHYRYTLTPPATPAGTDPVDFFLFTSRQGYCQYFAASMGDLLRALGLPARLVNGFGPGTWDPQHQDFVVRESDAHTWVEVYFPGYGWIAFEPTPQAPYQPIQRGPMQAASCSDAGCVATAAGTGSAAPSGGAGQAAPAATAAPAPARRAGAGGDVRPLLDGLAVAALGALALLAGALAFLNPRRAGVTWRRTLLLGRLAGVPARRSETPAEFGRRLAGAVPEAERAVGSLVAAVAAVAYAPPSVASRHVAEVGRSWRSMRPALLRRAGARLVSRLLPSSALTRHRSDRPVP